jgi:hypothetical protein
MAFDILQDSDIITKQSASITAVQAYNDEEGGDGPDPENLSFEMTGAKDSAWNQRVVAILLEKFREAEKEEGSSLPGRSDIYVKDLIQERFKRIRGVWRKSQRCMKASGELESEGEWEGRVVTEQMEQLKKARHLTRRRAVSKLTCHEASGTESDKAVRTTQENRRMDDSNLGRRSR